MTMVFPTPPQTQPAPVLPKWNDAQAVAAYLTSLVSAAVGTIAAVHPGFTEPALVQGLVPIAALVVAGAAQIVNVVTHRSAHQAVAGVQAANLIVHQPAPVVAPEPPSPAELASQAEAAIARLQEAVAAAAKPQ